MTTLLTQAQIKPEPFQTGRNLFFLFLFSFSFSFYTSTNKTKIVSNGPELFSFLFLPRGGSVSCLHGCLGARLFPQSYQYPNLSEGADRVGGQQRGDKKCSLSGVTNFGRVWRKLPESDARSVIAGPSMLKRVVPADSTARSYRFAGILKPCSSVWFYIALADRSAHTERIATKPSTVKACCRKAMV